MSELYNIGIEQLILASLLSNNDLYDNIASILYYYHFYEKIHQEIYKAIQKKLNNGEIANALTIMNILSDKGVKSEYIVELVEMISPTYDLVSYANLLRKLRVGRELKNLGAYLNTINNPEKVDEYLDYVDKQCYDLSEDANEHEPIDFYTEAQKSLNYTMQIIQREKKVLGISSGFKQLDSCIGGLRSGELIILAARPAMGKTALALNIATNIALQDQSVLFFSLEMPASQLCYRIISSLSKLSLSALIHGNIAPHVLKDCMNTLNKYSNLPLYILDTPSINVGTIKSIIRRMKRQNNISCVIIDYLQLIESMRYTNDTHEQEISRISRALKVLARELNIPVIALSQMSRDIEKRKDTPRLSDLRGSGSIEQDADIIIFLHKEDIHSSHVSLSVAKNRNGPLITIDLDYFGEITTFAESLTSPSFYKTISFFSFLILSLNL